MSSAESSAPRRQSERAVLLPLRCHDGSGENAAAAPDYALIAPEINFGIQLSRSHEWDIGCLYNQETDEHPQLYFSHLFKTGDSVELAHQIRAALDLTNSKFG
jgi:hypothetical protein